MKTNFQSPTPYAELNLHRSAGAAEFDTVASEAFRRRWSVQCPCDPFFDSNLSLQDADYRIRAGGARQ